MGNKQFICTTCYRSFENKEDMVVNVSGEISNICKTCKNILGKGAGYADKSSDDFSEKWFEGIEERKSALDTS